MRWRADREWCRCDRAIELRVADKGVLHDRLIVGEGFVDTIGTSINTVGRQHPTVLTPLPSPAADTMREQAEKWWADAKSLAKWPPPEAPGEHAVDTS